MAVLIEILFGLAVVGIAITIFMLKLFGSILVNLLSSRDDASSTGRTYRNPDHARWRDEGVREGDQRWREERSKEP